MGGKKTPERDQLESMLREFDRDEAKAIVPRVVRMELFERYASVWPAVKERLEPFTFLELEEADIFAKVAYLKYCYLKHEGKQHTDKWNKSLADLIIAAYSFQYNARIITRDGNGFPRPFFSDAFSPKILGNMIIHTLKPEIEVYQSILMELVASWDRKREEESRATKRQEILTPQPQTE